MSATTVQDADQRYVVVAHREVTETKLAELERKRLVSDLEQRDEILAQFATALP